MLNMNRFDYYLTRYFYMKKSDTIPTERGFSVGIRSCLPHPDARPWPTHAFMAFTNHPSSVPVTMEIAGHSGEFRVFA